MARLFDEYLVVIGGDGQLLGIKRFIELKEELVHGAAREENDELYRAIDTFSEVN